MIVHTLQKWPKSAHKRSGRDPVPFTDACLTSRSFAHPWVVGNRKLEGSLDNFGDSESATVQVRHVLLWLG